MRWMHLRFSHFAIDRLLRGRAETKTTLLALSRPEKGRDILVAASQAAEKLGVRPGQTAAAARALASQLLVRPHDEAADLRDLKRLALVLFRFSPDLVLDPNPSAWDSSARGLFLEIGRTAHLFDGENALVTTAQQCVEALGFRTSLAVANRASAARAFTWSRPSDPRLISATDELTLLRRLPWAALEPTKKNAERLRLLGLATLKDLEDLPRAGSRARLGAELQERLDRTLGRSEEILVRHTAPARIQAEIEWWPPLIEQSSLVFAISRLLDQVAVTLQARGLSLARAILRFVPAEGHHKPSFLIEPSRPTARAAILLRLAQHRLENFQLEAAVEGVEIEVLETEKLRGAQESLFEEETIVDEAEDFELIDRLIARLGPRRVARPALREDHRPEHSTRWRRPGSPLSSIGDSPSPPRRPFFIETPRALSVEVNENGEPTTLLRGPDRGPLQIAKGPERIEAGWWDGGDVRRLYFEVATEKGAHWWIYHDLNDDRWYRQGLFS